MNFKAVLFICIYTISIHEILPVTIQVDTLTIPTGITKTPGHTKITFFADQHIKSPSEQEQITSVINSLQEQRENNSYHILEEQASELNKLLSSKNKSASGYEILCTLDKHIKQAKPPMAHVRLDNVEVRNVTGPAMDFLNHYEGYKNYHQYKTDDAKKMIGVITFQDIFDEFDNIKQSLASYYLSQTNQTISDIYAHYIEIADKSCEQLKNRIACKSDVILEYAKAEYNKRVLQRWQTLNLSEEKEGAAKILAKSIELTFNHLFDLNLLKTILTSDSRNILVFAGGDHTKEVISMLEELKSMKLYQERNFTIKEKIEADGQKTRQGVVLPITGLQITRALSDQLQEKISSSVQPQEKTSYVPTIYCITLAAVALYYLMYVVIPTHGYA